MRSLPFNSLNHDRVYKAEDWAWYFDNFITNGVFPEPGDALQVVAVGGMNVDVLSGAAFIDGYAYKSIDSEHLIVGNADVSLNRVDAVVMRLDLPARDMYLDIVRGNPSDMPTAPTPKRMKDIYELVLAHVYVRRGATSITQADIKDTRFNSDICGICAGIIKQIDTSALGRQLDDFFDIYSTKVINVYQAYKDKAEGFFDEHEQKILGDYITYNQHMREYEKGLKDDFATWFDSIKDTLDGDTAGQIALNIEELSQDVARLEYMLVQNDIHAPIAVDDTGKVLLADDNGAVIVADWDYVVA